jgi:hypothetical protein
LVRSSVISTTSAVSIAISVPLPIAIPTSALARADASFIPSPSVYANAAALGRFIDSEYVYCVISRN